VPYAYACASIAYARWQKWKQAGGLCFVSRTREKMDLTGPRPRPIDHQDPNNTGSTADENGATSQGLPLRRIRYPHPATGEIHAFLTSALTLPPGVIAFVYLDTHRARMDYAEGKRRGEPIGSGAMESTCRQYQGRFKRPGQFWSQTGDEALLSLETFWRNGRWHLLFPHVGNFDPARN
jgi:hypothetical protein